MAKVILICGRLCSGKTTLARRIRQEQGGLLLSADEILTTVFHQDTGDRHEMILRDIKRYLLDKAVEAVGQGVDVLLDWGFWTREERKQTEAFFAQRGILREWLFTSMTREEHLSAIAHRNELVRAGRAQDYFVDEGLLRKAESLFEEPTAEEKCLLTGKDMSL